MRDEMRRQPPFIAIWERLESFPRLQRRIAEAVLQSPEIVAFGTIRDVATRLGANSATIVRFAQTLGYVGYSEFQATVRDAYLQRVAESQYTATSVSALRSPIEGLAFTRAQQLSNIEAAHRNVEASNIDAISGAIENARCVYIFGEAAAEVSGDLFVRLLRHVAIEGRVITNEIDAMIGLHDAGPPDVLIVFSLSMTYRTPVVVAEFAHNRGVPVIAIVGNSVSPLKRFADYSIVAPTQSATIWYSTVAIDAVVELIISHIASRRREAVVAAERELYEVFLDQSMFSPLESDRTKKL